MNWGLVAYVAFLSGASCFGGLGVTAYIATPAMRRETDFKKMFKQLGIVWIVLMAVITLFIYLDVTTYLSATPDRRFITTICTIAFAFAVTVFFFSGSKKGVLAIAAMAMAFIAPRLFS